MKCRKTNLFFYRYLISVVSLSYRNHIHIFSYRCDSQTQKTWHEVRDRESAHAIDNGNTENNVSCWQPNENDIGVGSWKLLFRSLLSVISNSDPIVTAAVVNDRLKVQMWTLLTLHNERKKQRKKTRRRRRMRTLTNNGEWDKIKAKKVARIGVSEWARTFGDENFAFAMNRAEEKRQRRQITFSV